jgi:hypothetical protein
VVPSTDGLPAGLSAETWRGIVEQGTAPWNRALATCTEARLIVAAPEWVFAAKEDGKNIVVLRSREWCHNERCGPSPRPSPRAERGEGERMGVPVATGDGHRDVAGGGNPRVGTFAGTARCLRGGTARWRRLLALHGGGDHVPGGRGGQRRRDRRGMRDPWAAGRRGGPSMALDRRPWLRLGAWLAVVRTKAPIEMAYSNRLFRHSQQPIRQVVVVDAISFRGNAIQGQHGLGEVVGDGFQDGKLASHRLGIV